MLSLILALLLLVFSVIYLKSNRKKSDKGRTVPGLKPSDPVLGNLPDLFKAGSLPNFLTDLHNKHGPLASFWWKDVFTVSLGDQRLFRQTERVFDRHPAIWEFAIPLISTKSMQYQNGEKGKEMFKNFAQAFNFESCRLVINEVKDEAVQVVKSYKDGEIVPLHKDMMELAVTIIVKTQFGGFFEKKENTEQFQHLYHVVTKDFDDAALGLWSFGQKDEREKKFERNLKDFKEIVGEIIEFHRKRRNEGEYTKALFLDIALDNVDDKDELTHQAITYMVGGFHTTGTYLSWILYFCARHPEVQDKMRKEIKETFGSEGLNSLEDATKLQYVNQVMDETLRYAKLATFTGRQAENDFEIDGFLIEKGTQLLNAICVTMNNESLFPQPEVFNPERFNPENKKAKLLANSPFGFGVRKCPGYRFSNMEVIVIVVELLTRFKVELANPDEEEIKPIYGFVAKPEREIFVKLKSV